MQERDLKPKEVLLEVPMGVTGWGCSVGRGRLYLPVPGDAVVKSRAWNILNAFHQFDQEIVVILPARRECDATVSLGHVPEPKGPSPPAS